MTRATDPLHLSRGRQEVQSTAVCALFLISHRLLNYFECYSEREFVAVLSFSG